MSNFGDGGSWYEIHDNVISLSTHILQASKSVINNITFKLSTPYKSDTSPFFKGFCHKLYDPIKDHKNGPHQGLSAKNLSSIQTPLSSTEILFDKKNFDAYDLDI